MTASRIPTVHLLVGLNGAGKTTHARRLEQELPAVRFSLDERLIRTHGPAYDDPAHAAFAGSAREEIWVEALDALTAGTDVVLDWNQWSRERRARWRDRARAAGFDVMVHHVRVPLDVAIARALARGTGPDSLSYGLDEAGVRHLATLLEEPSADEAMEIRVVDAS